MVAARLGEPSCRWAFFGIAMCLALGFTTGCGMTRDGAGGAAPGDQGDAAGAPEGPAELVPKSPIFLPSRPDEFEAAPEQAEVNLGPDARPTDYPAAQEWLERSPPRNCCTTASEVVSVDRELEGGGQLDMAWAEDRWGVVWEPHLLVMDNRIRFRTLTPDGVEVAPLEEIFETRNAIERPAMAWGNDRFAIAYRARADTADSGQGTERPAANLNTSRVFTSNTQD
jgi:hypothetical protein